MNADHAVLGCVLYDNRVYRFAAEVVSGADFEDARLGVIFDGIGQILARGGNVDAMSVESHYPDWDVRGLPVGAPHLWVEAGGFYPTIVADHARLVRAASLRRQGKELLAIASRDLDDTGVDPGQALELLARGINEVENAHRGDVLEAVHLKDVLAVDEEYDWIVPGLLERQDRLILTGHEGLGKSTFARQLMLLAGAGIHPFTDEPIEPVKSLVIDAENTAKQWRRNSSWLRDQAARSGSADPGVTVTLATSGRVNVLDARVLGNIHRLIDRFEPGMVFIGPLYRITPGAINTDTDAAEVIAALDTIRDRGVALVIEAHAGHAMGVGGQRDVRPRGSSALMGWPEFGLGIRSDMADPNMYELVPWRGSRESREWPKKLRKGGQGNWPWLVAERWDAP